MITITVNFFTFVFVREMLTNCETGLTIEIETADVVDSNAFVRYLVVQDTQK